MTDKPDIGSHYLDILRRREDAVCTWAADEIERLSENKWIKAKLVQLQAENAKLREALEKVAKCDGAYSPDALQHAINCMTNMRETARAALQKEGRG